MPINVAAILGAVAALTCTILSLVLITPENKRGSLNKFFKFIHDLFNFKFLIIEKILKVLYIFATLFSVAFGFFLLFAGVRTYSLWGGSDFHSTALYGLALMVLGPVFIRIFYEAMMMLVLVVKNVIQINNKLKGDGKEKEVDAFTYVPAAPSAPKTKFCIHCGAPNDKSSAFCIECGEELK